jgi:hypothetical protein
MSSMNDGDTADAFTRFDIVVVGAGIARQPGETHRVGARRCGGGLAALDQRFTMTVTVDGRARWVAALDVNDGPVDRLFIMVNADKLGGVDREVDLI